MLRPKVATALPMEFGQHRFIGIEKYQCLSRHRAVLRCAKTKRIDTGTPGEIGRAFTTTCDGISESGAIHE